MDKNQKLREILESSISKIPKLKEIVNRCLNSERWNGSVKLMILDAAITSTGVNYFQVVVPKLRLFEREFIESGQLKTLSDLSNFNYERAYHIWKNRRSWNMALEVARYLSILSNDSRTALREWAKKATLEGWSDNPIGKIKGVGLVTYQYLRMMGGVDTIMPDKIVKRVINSIFSQARIEQVWSDMEFIRKVEKLSNELGFRATELCFMTWFVGKEERALEMP